MGPFSNKKVIDYINEHFVPIYLSNEAYAAGKLGSQEKYLLEKIRRNAAAKNLTVGTVQVYMMNGDLDVTDTLHVGKASQTEELMKFMTVNALRMQAKKGKRLLPIRRQSIPSNVKDNELVVRVSAQFKELQPMPVESWVVLEEKEWQEFMPKATQEKWTVSEAMAAKLLVHLYPYAANWDEDLEQVTLAKIDVELVETTPQMTTYSLTGRVEMTHLLWPDSGRRMIATDLVGYVTIEPGKKPNIVFVSKEATFDNRAFDGLVHTVVDEINDEATLIKDGESVESTAPKEGP